MRHAIAATLLALAACGAAQASDTQEGHYASGWPIALAEAACDGDEGCLTKLAHCGPRDAGCAAGISLCTLRRGTGPLLSRPCQTDRITGAAGSAILFHLPGEGFFALHLGPDGYGSVNGAPARTDGPDCLKPADRDTRICARPLITPADFVPWTDRAQ